MAPKPIEKKLPASANASSVPGFGPEPEIELSALLGTILRRRWWVIGATLSAIVLGGVVSVRAPRIYQATATVLIEQAPPRVLSGVSEVYDLGAQGYWGNRQYYETQYRVIQSRAVAEIAARNLGLSAGGVADELRKEGEESLEAQTAGDPLHGLPEFLRRKLSFFGLDRLSTRAEMRDALENMDELAMISGRIEVNPVPESRLAKIAVRGRDAEQAAMLANGVADAYIEYNLVQKLDLTRSAVDWLSDQTRELRQKLETSEKALHAFKKANNIVSVSLEDRRSMIAQTLSELNGRLSETRGQRIALESRREQTRRVRDGEVAPGALDEVLSSTYIQKLREDLVELQQHESELAIRYTSEYPKLAGVRKRLTLVRQEMNEEINRVLTSLDVRYATALSTERRLRTAIDRVKSDALDLNEKEIEYTRLQRERDNNVALYQLVMTREKEADLTQMLKVNNIRKLENAQIPTQPISPNVKIFMLVALVLGLGIGIGLCFLVDYLDSSVKNESQLERIGLPFLGIIPAIGEEKGTFLGTDSERDRYIVGNPHSSVAECCRTVRTNLLFMSPEHQLKKLLVTSSSPREGKSTTVVNLAVSMALSGARTIIVETDMRRPRLHQTFSLGCELGLTNAIVGQQPVEEVIVPSQVDGLDILPCGPVPPNPSELLHTQRFAEIVDELEGRYDRLLFDSPPVVAVADPLVLAAMTDGVVIVAKANVTSLHSVQASVHRLRAVGARILGAVLNDVHRSHTGYTYSGYYSYYRPNGATGESKHASV